MKKIIISLSLVTVLAIGVLIFLMVDGGTMPIQNIYKPEPTTEEIMQEYRNTLESITFRYDEALKVFFSLYPQNEFGYNGVAKEQMIKDINSMKEILAEAYLIPERLEYEDSLIAFKRFVDLDTAFLDTLIEVNNIQNKLKDRPDISDPSEYFNKDIMLQRRKEVNNHNLELQKQIEDLLKQSKDDLEESAKYRYVAMRWAENPQ